MLVLALRSRDRDSNLDRFTGAKSGHWILLENLLEKSKMSWAIFMGVVRSNDSFTNLNTRRISPFHNTYLRVVVFPHHMAKLTWLLNLCSIYYRRVLYSALYLTYSSIVYAVQCSWLVLLLFQSAHFKGSKQHKVRRKGTRGNCWLFKQCYFFSN